MINKRFAELMVGVFIIAGFCALVVLAFQVSGLTGIGHQDSYQVSAEFDNIGGLKPRAPVTIAGVTVGRVGSIQLDPKTFRAKVILLINANETNLPKDTSASILTEGLLGSQYISLTPGFDTESLKSGSKIQETHSAMILENLIGQFLFNMKSDKNKDGAKGE